MLVIPWGVGGLFNYYYFEIIIVARPPPAKKKSNNNWPPPPLRKKVIIIQHPPAPPHRFRELFLPLKSFPGACSVTNFVYGSFFGVLKFVFLRLLNVFLGAFSASESVSEFLDAVLSFFTAVCVQFLLFEIIIVAPPPPPEKKKVIIIGRPPLRRKKVIIIQHPPAPLTGSGSYFCLSSRFRDLVLPLISSTASFFCVLKFVFCGY